MYSLNDCIRFGFLFGALFGVAIEALVALNGSDSTALQMFFRGTYGVAHAAGLS